MPISASAFSIWVCGSASASADAPVSSISAVNARAMSFFMVVSSSGSFPAGSLSFPARKNRIAPLPEFEKYALFGAIETRR